MEIWSKIETKKDLKIAGAAIQSLKVLKDILYGTCGNDDLFDYLDGAIANILEQTDSATRKKLS